MSRITAKLVNHSWDVSGAGNTAGVPEYSYREVYRVPWGLYDDGTENPYARRSDSPTFVYEAIDPDYQSGVDPPEEEWLVGGLPRLYETKTFPSQYQPPGEDPPPAIPDIPAEDQRTYYVVGYSAQLFTDPSASATYWEFIYEYDANFGLFKNDGTAIQDDPTELASSVEVLFDQEWEIVNDAVFLGLAKAPPADESQRGFIPTIVGDTAPEWLKTNGGMAVCNSAKQQRDVNRPKPFAEVHVTTVVDNLSQVTGGGGWADSLWTTNSNQFRIHDGANGQFNVLFQPGWLLLQRIAVANWFWHKQKKYAQVRLEFRAAGHENRYHLREYAFYHYEPDRGNALFCYYSAGGQINSGPHGSGTENAHTQDDITRLVNEFGSGSPDQVVKSCSVPWTVNVTDANGGKSKATMSGDFRLNGFGQPSGYTQPGGVIDDGLDEYFTCWKIYKSSVFDFGLDQVSP